MTPGDRTVTFSATRIGTCDCCLAEDVPVMEFRAEHGAASCEPCLVTAMQDGDLAAQVEPIWHVRSRAINEVVRAADQFGAWDTVRDRPIGDFGLIVTAERDEDADLIPVQTEMLMRRWGRDTDAAAFHALAVKKGLVDV